MNPGGEKKPNALQMRVPITVQFGSCSQLCIAPYQIFVCQHAIAVIKKKSPPPLALMLRYVSHGSGNYPP